MPASMDFYASIAAAPPFYLVSLCVIVFFTAAGFPADKRSCLKARLKPGFPVAVVAIAVSIPITIPLPAYAETRLPVTAAICTTAAGTVHQQKQ